jgi:hypothetical protein
LLLLAKHRVEEFCFQNQIEYFRQLFICFEISQ